MPGSRPFFPSTLTPPGVPNSRTRPAASAVGVESTDFYTKNGYAKQLGDAVEAGSLRLLKHNLQVVVVVLEAQVVVLLVLVAVSAVVPAVSVVALAVAAVDSLALTISPLPVVLPVTE